MPDGILGLLPEIRGGLRELAKTGQHFRFIEGYLKPYTRAFEEIRYFSYLPEVLAEYTDDAELLAKVRLLPGGNWHPWLYAFLMSFRYRRELRGCAVLRVYQATGLIPALVAKRFFGVPFVATYGYLYPRFARSWARGLLHRWVEAVGLPAADAVIVTTPELATHVAGKVGEGKVHLIPNGVDTTLFRPAARPPSPVKNVLFVGRLAAQKNLSILIEAAGKLVGRFSLRLTFVGDGPLRGCLEASARRVNVPLGFVPFVDHRKLPALFAEADAFVLPSYIEGHPKVLLEAMSCGVPCVASDVEGNRTIVSDGETGLLFDPGDADGLAERLERLFTEEEFARGLGERGRSRAVECYDLGTLVKREIELLRRIAASRP